MVRCITLNFVGSGRPGQARGGSQMGLIRKAIRQSTPKPVRKATRTVHQAIHPVSTARRAVTPAPVKRATSAAHSVAHPFEALEHSAESAVLNALPGRTARTRPVSNSEDDGASRESSSRRVASNGWVEVPKRVTDDGSARQSRRSRTGDSRISSRSYGGEAKPTPNSARASSRSLRTDASSSVAASR